MTKVSHAPTIDRLGVVTVSFGSDMVLPAFLSSVSAADRPVIVADNAPHVGDSASIARDHDARYLAVPDNPGYGAAVNLAVQMLPGDIEWVLISNPDVVVHPGAIELLLSRAASDPAIGAVGPRILTSDRRTYPSARRIPSLRTGAGHAVFAAVWPSNPWSRAYRNDGDVSGPRDAGWLSGSCLLVRRSAFAEIGGFDTGYFMYFEDVDLGYRLGRAGYRNVYSPDAVVTHTGAHSTSERADQMSSAHHASARRFLRVRYPRRIHGPIRAVTSAGLWIRERVLRMTHEFD